MNKRKIRERGCTDFAVNLSEETKRSLVELKERAIKKKRKIYNSGRSGFSLSPFQITCWNELLRDSAVDQLLKEYFQSEASLLSVDIINVAPFAKQQRAHRDHQLGPFKSACLVISLDNTSPTTLISQRSHITSGENLEPFKTTKNSLFYDTYCTHAGAANHTNINQNNRIFFVFVTASLEKKEIAHLNGQMGSRRQPIKIETL